MFDGDSLRTQNGHSLGVSAAGDGVRIWDDVLAPPARLARSGRVGQHLACIARRTRIGRRDRLVNGHHRQLLHPRAFWGAKTGPNPTDRGKNGTKRHLITDGCGMPLAIEHTGASVHDSEMAIAWVDAIEPIKRPRGRPRKRPERVFADRAYDAEKKIRQPLASPRHRTIHCQAQHRA